MIYLYILAMALTTYLIRMLPLTLFKKQIKNIRIRSFLYYVPYSCLTAMTVPSIFSATASIISALAGFLVAMILGFFERSLPVVALCACIVVFITERILML